MGHRKIRIIARRRKEPDYRKLSRALLELAAAQVEADAQAAHQAAPADIEKKAKAERRADAG